MFKFQNWKPWTSVIRILRIYPDLMRATVHTLAKGITNHPLEIEFAQSEGARAARLAYRRVWRYRKSEVLKNS